MKCRYRFRVHGRIRPSINVPVPCRGWTYELETFEGLVTDVVVVVPLPRREDWPLIQRDPVPGVKAQIQPKTPHLPFIQRELRALQGLLALFGLHSIDLDDPEIEWLPESEEERAELYLFSFKRRAEPLSDDHIPRLPLDLMARSIIASDAATDIEVPLNFFRRGMLDVYDRNYIEAIYDFYFVLETLFADGKFKKAAVLEAFRSSDQLRSSVELALADPGTMLIRDRSTREDFRRVYSTLSVEQALEKIVELRGHLHHHTQKRRNTWHPDEQRRFECDALFLQAVAYNVVFKLAEPYLWDEEVVNAYEELAQRYHERTHGDAG